MGKEEIDDGAWWIAYLAIDLALAALDIALAIAMLCFEIVCWTLAGGFDALFYMLGFRDDEKQ